MIEYEIKGHKGYYFTISDVEEIKVYTSWGFLPGRDQLKINLGLL